MKTFKLILSVIIFLFCFGSIAYAQIPENHKEIYDRQFKLSGAYKVKSGIPKKCMENLENAGIKEGSWSEICALDTVKVMNMFLKIIKDNFSSPFKSFLPIVGIMLLCVITNNVKPCAQSENLSQVLASVSVLCISFCVINPIVKLIGSVSLIIKTASDFILVYVPVMTTILMASGNAVSAASYHTSAIIAGQAISYLSEKFIIPTLCALLGISVLSCVSPVLNLGEFCKNAHKAVKFILELVSFIFTGVLTMQNLVSSSADSLTAGTVKFALNGCVPIVGGMISDAFETVKGCIKLLKCGVGAFGIIAGATIFLPVLAESLLWIFFLNVFVCVGNVLELRKISSLLKSVSGVMSTVLALIVFSLVILIVSSVIVLAVGGR